MLSTAMQRSSACPREQGARPCTVNRQTTTALHRTRHANCLNSLAGYCNFRQWHNSSDIAEWSVQLITTSCEHSCRQVGREPLRASSHHERHAGLHICMHSRCDPPVVADCDPTTVQRSISPNAESMVANSATQAKDSRAQCSYFGRSQNR